ncbi:MAG: four helix bundle protein [bacterium]
MTGSENFNEKYRKRTFLFSIQICKFYGKRYADLSGRVIANQIVRSATSVAANFRAATRGRSPAEYYAKLCIVVEECDETVFWLELYEKTTDHVEPKFFEIKTESIELLKIFSTTKKNLKSPKS